MSEHERWTGYPESYALDALDAAERATFEAHLAACSACRAAVQAHAEVAGALAQAAPPMAPPASLRARVLADARRVRPIGSAPPPDARAADDAAPVAHARAAEDLAPPSLGAVRADGPRPAGWLPWLAAAAVLLAVTGLTLHQLERRVRAQTERRLAMVAGQADSARAQVALLDSLLAQRDSALESLLAEGGRTLTLAARGQPPSARIHWNQARGRIVVSARDLPPAGAGRTYQLWGIRAGEPVSLGTFDTDAGGRATAVFDVDPALTFEVSAVTEEPAGGSPLPTTTPFLVGDWTATR